MKKTIAAAVAAGIGLCAFAGPSFAYTLNGTIPAASKPAVIDLHKPIPSRYNHVILTLTTAPKSAGIGYEVEFCVGPAANPCPLPIRFLGGQQIIVAFTSSDLSTYTLTLTQATSAAAPYTLKVDYSH